MTYEEEGLSHERTVFEELLVSYDIELKEAASIRRYTLLTEEEREDVRDSNQSIIGSFDALENVLLFRNPGLQPQDLQVVSRLEALEPCRDAIKSLVRFFGLATKRDPRAIIKSSTHRITRKEYRLTPHRE